MAMRLGTGHSWRQYWQSKLTPLQRKAAEMLVANELGFLSENGKLLTKDKLAEKIGVTRKNLYKWMKDENFVTYVNELAEIYIEELALEYRKELTRLARLESTEVLDRVARLEFMVKVLSRT
jgi:hypothetical protein